MSELCLHFAVYVKDPLELPYPSSVSERSGRIVGMAEHQSDALTFLVLGAITGHAVARSIFVLLLGQMEGRSEPMMVTTYNHLLMLQGQLLIHLL